MSEIAAKHTANTQTFFIMIIFFDILLVFVFFLHTYCGIYCSYILFFHLFPLQTIFYFYNLLLYLESPLGFFDNMLN